MKRIFHTLSIILLSTALMCPTLQADDRGRGRGGGSSRTHSPATPSRTQRPGNNRPGNSGQPVQRPGNNRPGNSGQPAQRPGNSRPGHNSGHRPGNTWRPGNDRPGGPGNPGMHHPQPPRPPHHHGNHGPVRPHMRPHSPFMRPTPPPAWRPAPGWRPFHTILGVALGSTISFTVNSLINSGYTVASYGNNQVYLNNVPMLNLLWPDAIMYYNTAGQLYGSRFIFSSPGYDTNYYNMAYTSLTATYGAPVSIQSLPNGTEATWWGTGNQFIRLSYLSDYANNGLMRYYTTLSFGN